MNAVKRCLALFAATVAIGACSGDPTADLAGKNLTIRATPGAVWLQNATTQTILLEAIDATGAPAPGNWTAVASGVATVVADTAFEHTTTGHIGQGRQYIIGSTAEGEGRVIFTGTGGADTIPVRVTPDPLAFHAVANDTTPALFQPITITAPAGVVFTGSSTVRFETSVAAIDSANGGLGFPVVTGISADSSQITFIPGPGAHGYAKISGVANRSTPTNTVTARTDFLFAAVPSVDTTLAGLNTNPHFTTGTRSTSSYNDTLTITAPAGYVFLPTTTIEFFRLVGSNITATNLDGYTVSNGTAAPVKVSLSADSTVMKWLVAPGARGRLKIKNIAFRNAPAINFRFRDDTADAFDLRAPASGTGPDTANFAFTFSKASPIAEGDTVTAIAPAGTVFLAGVGSVNSGSSSSPSGGDSVRISLRSADSSKVTFILPPGASGKFRYSAMGRRDHPEVVWQARGQAISAAAAPAVVATMTPSTANMNDTVTVALSAVGPYRFRPSSQGLLGGFSSLVTSISADSLTMKLLAPPGLTGPLTLTNIRYSNLPTFQVVAQTASSLTMNAAFSLGQDDPGAGAVPIINAPDSVTKVVGFWDQASETAPDYTGDDGAATGNQYYRIHATRTGNVLFSVDWSQGTKSNTDIDFILVNDDGTWDTPVGKVTSGAAANKPETATYALVAGTNYILAIIDFAASGLDGGGFSGLATTTGISVTMTGK